MAQKRKPGGPAFRIKIEKRPLKSGTISVWERLSRYNPEKGYTEHLASRRIGIIPPGEEEMIPLRKSEIPDWDWEKLGCQCPPDFPDTRASLPDPPEPPMQSDTSSLTFPADSMLLAWSRELQSLAQAGIFYSKDPFDVERFLRIREISAEMLSTGVGLPFSRVQEIFCGDTGYQTPKLDTRAAVFQEDRILLVQERTGLWALPGGWMEPGLSIRENTVKEAQEEAGVQVRPDFLIAIHNQERHNTPANLHRICKVFVRCTFLGGSFAPNLETIDSRFFSRSNLPPLSTGKTTLEQIRLCFQANRADRWTPVFD